MRRETHKERTSRQDFIKETNKRYFARLANEKVSDSAREAFRRPAHYGANIKKKENENDR